MRTISAEITGNAITTLVFEHHEDGSVKILDDEIIPRSLEVSYFTIKDEELIRQAYPNLAPDTKLFVCRP